MEKLESENKRLKVKSRRPGSEGAVVVVVVRCVEFMTDESLNPDNDSSYVLDTLGSSDSQSCTHCITLVLTIKKVFLAVVLCFTSILQHREVLSSP